MSNNTDKNIKCKQLAAGQQQFVEYLADPDNTMTPGQFADSIGVLEVQLQEWKSDPAVVQAVFRLSATRFGAEIPKMLKMLLEKALANQDVAACKLYFQQLDKTVESPETGVSTDEVFEILNQLIDTRFSEKKEP